MARVTMIVGALVLLAVRPWSAGAQPKAPEKLQAVFDEGVYDYPGSPLRWPPKLGRIAGVKVTASSSLCPGKSACHPPRLLFDGDPKTAWCEGGKGDGVGEWIALELDRPRRLLALVLTQGYAKDRRRWLSNGRLKTIEIQTDHRRFVVTLPDAEEVFEPGAQIDYPVPVVELQDPPLVTRRLKLVVRAVHAGKRFKDLCMSELGVYLR